MTPDEQPWLEVANRVLAGEFAGADTSTLKSLTIGLRLIDNPVCKQALVKLEKMREKKKRQSSSLCASTANPEIPNAHSGAS